MKNSQITITKKQAIEAFGLCIKNIKSFIQDTKILLKEDKLDHIIIPIQFAMEEIGKAKILEGKINNSTEKITLTKDDGWLNHEKKVEIASELIELPEYQKQLIDSYLGHYPMDFFSGFPIGMLLADAVENGELEELQDKAKQGHSLRLESSFVGFDKNTGDPMIGKGLPREDVVSFLLILNDGLKKLE